ELAELQVAKKAPADFVSAADLKSEQLIFEALSKARPGYGFLAEERGMIEGTDKTHTWIVDPLDGTTNFLHAIPHFAINIARQRDLAAWDMAAGVLLVTEAGGKVSNADGEDEVLGQGSICAGNLDLQPQLLQRLRAAK